MGINPAMGMGYGFGGDDFYTQMLYQQMMNGGAGASSWTNGGNGTNGTNNSQTATQKQGIGLFGGAAITGTAAGAGYLGMNYLNHQFNSPVEEVKGKVRFTDDFMKRFSGEYQSIKNETGWKNLLSDLSKEVAPDRAKFSVTDKNIESILEELKMFVEDPSNPKVADMSDDLKGFLKQRMGKSVPAAGATIPDADKWMYELVDNDVDAIRKHYAETMSRVSDLEFSNNYNLQKSVYESFDDFVKGLDDCKDTASKIDYLRSNRHAAGLTSADLDTLLKKGVGDAEVDAIFNRVKSVATDTTAAGRKAQLKSGYEALEHSMQSFAKKWDSKIGFLGKGKFNIFDKKTGGALDNALAAMRRGKGGKYAAIAAGAAAIGCLLYNA